MRPGQQLLLPAKPLFIAFSLLAALVLNMLLNVSIWGHAAWRPDVLAVVLVFWGVNQPGRVGVIVAFFFGLLMDIHQGALLGQHALAYTLLGFFAAVIHRRLMWFDLVSQAAHVLGLLMASQLVTLLVRMASGGQFPGWSYFLAPLLGAALWPVVHSVLLAPQRRAPNPDKNRPI
ncbi:MAG: rod shape-determining protein MreD [Pseudomonadota bacterium]|jgi:rod shape-determining protein MreD